MFSHHPDSSRSPRITSLRIALAVSLLCIGAGTALHHRMLTDVQKQIDDTVRTPRVAALENRVAELSGTLGEFTQKPLLDVARHEADLKTMETRQETMKQEIAERLTALELSTEERRMLSDLAALETRIEALEIRISELSDLLSPSVTPSVPLSDENDESGTSGANGTNSASDKGAYGESPLPFEVIDVEVRGGAHFVVIDDLAGEPRILYPGDVEKGWRLDGVDEKTAIFRHGETTRRVALPAVQP